MNPFRRTLTSFVAFLDPPEARKIWILSYLEWIYSETRLDEDLGSLMEQLLLKEVSDGSAYKMHKVTCMMVLKGLRGEKGIVHGIAEFLDSKKFIPQPPSMDKSQTYIVFPESREEAGQQGLTTEPKPSDEP